MKYFVALGGRTIEVELDGETVLVDGSVIRAALTRTPHTPICELVLDGRPRLLVLRRDRTEWHAQTGGQAWAVAVQDERTRQIEALTGQSKSASGAGVIRAPMPGMVLRVEVEEGQAVESGAGLIVLEAMKMENEISAPTAGRVRAVRVGAGEAVEKGAVLVEIGELEA